MSKRPLTPYDATVDTNHAEVTLLAGWSLYAAPGNNVRLRLRRQTDEGQVLAEISIPAGESDFENLDPVCSCADGVYLEKVGSGSVTGVLYQG